MLAALVEHLGRKESPASTPPAIAPMRAHGASTHGSASERSTRSASRCSFQGHANEHVASVRRRAAAGSCRSGGARAGQRLHSDAGFLSPSRPRVLPHLRRRGDAVVHAAMGAANERLRASGRERSGAGAHHRREGSRHRRLLLERSRSHRLPEGHRRRRKRPRRRRRPVRWGGEGRDAVPRCQGADRRHAARLPGPVADRPQPAREGSLRRPRPRSRHRQAHARRRESRQHHCLGRRSRGPVTLRGRHGWREPDLPVSRRTRWSRSSRC